MDSLSIAERLSKKSNSRTTVAPVSVKKLSDIKFSSKTENIDQNLPLDQKKKLRFNIEIKPTNAPPISEVFSDEKLKKYFTKFLTERKLGIVIQFIDYVAEYRNNFPESPEKQVSQHRFLIELLGSLPNQFVKIAATVSRDMTSINKNSFDSFIALLISALHEREYKSFLNSEHFSKWRLKYQNIH